MKTTKKALLLTVCALVLVVATVMGTMAYLTAKDDVKNTFAAAQLLKGDFVLTEHKLERNATTGVQSLSDSETTDTNDYKIVPGASLPKDPFAQFTLAETAYLFVAVDNNLPTGMTFAMDDNWKELKNGEDQIEINGMPVWVYGTEALEAKEEAYTINIIKDQKVNVAGDINLEPGDNGQAVGGTLNFYGYLVQGQTFDSPLAAWTAWQDSLKA